MEKSRWTNRRQDIAQAFQLPVVLFPQLINAHATSTHVANSSPSEDITSSSDISSSNCDDSDGSDDSSTSSSACGSSDIEDNNVSQNQNRQLRDHNIGVEPEESSLGSDTEGNIRNKPA